MISSRWSKNSGRTKRSARRWLIITTSSPAAGGKFIDSRTDMLTDQHVGTVVIGGRQGGLSVGYHRKQQGVRFVILDENDRIGDAWRRRWDSLRLFTPGRYDGLPGMQFPGSPSSYPTKDEAADYLERYARTFELPVRTGVKVDRLSKVGDSSPVSSGGRRV